MNVDHRVIAGWFALITAILIALSTTAQVVLTNSVGASGFAAGLTGTLLAFAASCFGLTTYHQVTQTRLTAAARHDPPSSPPT